jgi:hypothetical protein
MYMNFQAFNAAVWAIGVFRGDGRGESWAAQVMRDAFETQERREAWEKECYIITAALWIIIYGQCLFHQIRDGDVSQGKTQQERNWAWRFGEGIPELEAMEPRSVERWQFWQHCFDRVAQDSTSTKECTGLALRTAGLMKSMELSML